MAGHYMIFDDHIAVLLFQQSGKEKPILKEARFVRCLKDLRGDGLMQMCASQPPIPQKNQ